MSSLLDDIQADYQKAFKKRDEVVVATLRLLLAAVHDREIEKRARKEELTKEDVLAVAQKEAKKRKEAIEAYEKGQRQDLVAKEKKELAILEGYLPAQLADQELKKIIQEAIGKTQAQGLKDMGRVVGLVMSQVKGRAEGKRVSQLVKEALGQ